MKSVQPANGNWAASVCVMLFLLAATLAPVMSAGAGEGPAPLAYLPPERPPELLPTDHWAYDELQKLWVAGMVDSMFVSSRPASRYDVAALLIPLQSDPRVPAGYAPVERLLREFSREISYLGGDAGYQPMPYMSHSRSEKTDFRLSLYVDGEWVSSEGSWVENVKGSGHTVEGSRVGIQSTAILRPNLVIYQDVYAGKMTGGWRYGEELFSITDFIIFADRFYAALRTPWVDAQVGRDKVRWGPGRTGTLLLSDGADSYTMLHLTRTFGRKLKVSSVSGILDTEAGKYLAAHRIDFAPAGFMQFGLAETAIYHSEFFEPLYVMSLVPFTLVERLHHKDAQSGGLEDDPTRNNVSVSVDAIVRPVWGTSVYGELMIDDLSEETSKRPTRLAYQAGLSVLRPVGNRSVSLTAELTRVWNYTYNVYYSDTYDRDQTHQGRPLGYYLGPDTRHWHFSLSADVSRDLELTGVLNVTHRGEGSLGIPWTPDMEDADASELSGVVERTTELRLRVRWMPVETVLLETSATRIAVKNRNHETSQGGDWEDNEYRLGVSARW